MKFLTIAFVVCAAISYAKAEEFNKEKFQELAKACKEETGASDGDLDIVVKHEDATTNEAKCMRACIMKKLNTLDENGHLIKENMLKVVQSLAAGDAEKEKAGTALLDSCAELEVSADHCESAEQYAKCLRNLADESA